MFYDYKCTNEECKTIKEVKHGMLEKPEIKCDTCQTEMKRIISGNFGVVRGKSQNENISSTNTDILRYQAKVLSETQGGLQ